MIGIVLVLGVLVSLGGTSATPVSRYSCQTGEWSRIICPRDWEAAGKSIGLTFVEGQTSTIIVDFCQIYEFPDIQYAQKLTWSDKYICNMVSFNQKWCRSWSQVAWTTSATGLNVGETLKERLRITEAANLPCTHKGNCNQLLITLQEPQLQDDRLFTMAAYVAGMGNFYL